MKGIFIFSTAALAVFVLSIPVRRVLLRSGVLDRPTGRSSHECPTVRGGGVAIMLVILVGAVALSWRQHDTVLFGLALLASFLAAVSLVDDFKSVTPIVRFSCHAAAALGAILFLEYGAIRFEIGPELFWNVNAWVGAIVGFLWLTGYTNAFNFMDGINGIAASQAVLTAAGTGLLVGAHTKEWDQTPVLICSLIAGAAAGFIPHNFPRARMFMGDVSSAPLGFLLAALVLWFARDIGWWLLFPFALLHLNFVLDTGVTLLRRLFRREHIFDAHREHFYQRLVRAGKSHSFVTGWEVGLQLVVLGLMFCYLHAGTLLRLVLILCVLALWGAFFVFCEFKFLRAQFRVPPPPAPRHDQTSSKVTAPNLPLRS